MPKKLKLKSGYEKKVRASLNKRKIPFEYEKEVIEYTIPETKRKYLPDFYLKELDMYVEAKGKWDRIGRQKMLYVIQQNPDKDIRMLFMRNNTIAKNSKTKYSDWCQKRGIKYHISGQGEIPLQWLEKTK